MATRPPGVTPSRSARVSTVSAGLPTTMRVPAVMLGRPGEVNR
ncbi:hypothetical protein ACFRDV_12615 [Streptomyces fagopyri]